jgi:hypothetical protein
LHCHVELSETSLIIPSVGSANDQRFFAPLRMTILL